MNHNRAVSSILGFALILGIVAIGTGVVLFYGSEAIAEDSTEQTISASISNFELLDTAVRDHSNGAPRRSTQMASPGSPSLSYGDTYRVVVFARDGPSDTLYMEANVQTIRYTIQRGGGATTTIRYSGGLISRENSRGGDSVLLREPPMRNVDGRAVFIIPNFERESGTPSSVAASGGQNPTTVSTQLDDIDSERFVGTTSSGRSEEIPGNVTIYNAPDPEAWASFFRQSESFSAPSGGFVSDRDGNGKPDVRANFQAKTTFVKSVKMQMAFGGGGDT